MIWAFINLKSRMPFGELTSNCSLWLRFCTSSANSFRMGVVTWADMSLYLGIVKENGFKHLWVLVPDFNCPLHYWGVGWVDPVKQHHVGSLKAKYSPRRFTWYDGCHKNSCDWILLFKVSTLVLKAKATPLRSLASPITVFLTYKSKIKYSEFPALGMILMID